MLVRSSVLRAMRLVAFSNALRLSPSGFRFLAQVFAEPIKALNVLEASTRAAALPGLGATGKIQSTENTSVPRSDSVESVFEPNMRRNAPY